MYLKCEHRKHFVLLVAKKKKKSAANILFSILFYLSFIVADNSDDILMNTWSLRTSFSLSLCSQCSFFTPLGFLCQVPTCQGFVSFYSLQTNKRTQCHSLARICVLARHIEERLREKEKSNLY